MATNLMPKAASSNSSPRSLTSDGNPTARLQFLGLGRLDTFRSKFKPATVPTATRAVTPNVTAVNASAQPRDSISQSIFRMCKENRDARRQRRKVSSTATDINTKDSSTVNDDSGGSSNSRGCGMSTPDRKKAANSGSKLVDNSDGSPLSKTPDTSDGTSILAKLHLEAVGDHVMDMTEKVRQLVEDCIAQKLTVDMRNSELEARNTHLEAHIAELGALKLDLEEKHKKINDLRRKDFEKLTDYAEVNKNLCDEYDEMKQEFMDSLVIESVKIVTLRKLKQHQAKTQENEVARLQRSLNAEKVKVKNADAAITLKDQELEKLRAATKRQEEELESKINNIKNKDAEVKNKDAEIEEVKGLWKEENMKLLEASKITQNTLEAQIQTQASQLALADADLKELHQKNEAEIMRITAKCQCLIDLNKAMELQLKFGNVNNEHMRQYAQSYNNLVKEMRKIIQERDTFREQVEGVLDNELQTRAHLNTYREKARDADQKLSRAQDKIAHLETKLTGEVEANVLKENEFLRKRNCELVEENDGLRRKFSKAEDEIFKNDIQESFDNADKVKAKEVIENANKTIANLQIELGSFGIKFTELKDNSQLQEADARIMQQLHILTQENQALREAQTPLHEELETNQSQLRDAMRRLSNLQDCENEWHDRYYTEFIDQMNNLHDEIDLLKKEKGETYYDPSSHSFDKAVAERNYQRMICATRLVSREKCPNAELLEVWDWIGAVTATEYALRKLRPLGWVPIRQLGKMWLTPAVKAFTEEDAMERLEAMQGVDWEARRTELGLPNQNAKVAAPTFGAIGSHRPPITPAIPQKELTGQDVLMKPPPGLGFSRPLTQDAKRQEQARKRGGRSKFVGTVIPVENHDGKPTVGIE